MGSTLLRLLVCVAAFAGLGVAQDASAAQMAIAQLPSCALKCLLIAIEESPCTASNVTCQCTNTQLTTTAELCITGSCTIEESLTAKNVTQTMCGAPIRDKSVEYNVVSTTLMGLACAFVLVRLGYKKFFTSTDLGLDDWFIFATLLNCVPSAVININMLTANGLGKDIWTLTPEMITEFALAFWIITMLYFSEVFVLKLAMLTFYLRIFPSPQVRRLILGTIAFNVLFGIAFILTAVLQCRPISYNWTNWRGEGGGQCVNISAVAWANAGVSIALDLWMLAIPLSQLKDLKLHWKKKIGVAMMFGVGTFVTVVSVIRLASLVMFRESTNLTWDYWGVSLWSTVEITVGIICACMPSMRLILVRIAPKIFDASLARRSYYYPRRGKTAEGSATGKSTNAPTQSDISKAGTASRQSWRPQVRTSWRVSSSPQDSVFVDGVMFSKVGRSNGDASSDMGRLVPMEDIELEEAYKSEVKITAGRAHSDDGMD